MAAPDPEALDRWRGLALVDQDGVTVGTISEFYLDRETGSPTWALVATGLFGTKQTFVPLLEAAELADGVQVPYLRVHVKEAPGIEPDGELTPTEEARLFAHYGLEYAPAREGPGPAGEPAEGDAAAWFGTGEEQPAAPATAPAPAAPAAADVPAAAGAADEPPQPATAATPTGAESAPASVTALEGKGRDPGSTADLASAPAPPPSPAARADEPAAGGADAPTADTPPFERVRLRLERWLRSAREELSPHGRETEPPDRPDPSR